MRPGSIIGIGFGLLRAVVAFTVMLAAVGGCGAAIAISFFM